MKVYISGAITGNPDYKEQFQRAEDYLRSKGYTPVNPSRMNTILDADAFTHEEFMKADLAILDMCDAIYLLKDWQKSDGARQEMEYAYGKKKNILYEYSITREPADCCLYCKNKRRLNISNARECNVCSLDGKFLILTSVCNEFEAKKELADGIKA